MRDSTSLLIGLLLAELALVDAVEVFESVFGRFAQRTGTLNPELIAIAVASCPHVV